MNPEALPWIKERKARIAEFHGILAPYGELSSVSELRGCEFCGLAGLYLAGLSVD